MKKQKDLSPAEWEIMQVVWSADRAVTIRDVMQRAYPNSEKAYTTVQTLANILVDKGFLKREKMGPVNFYAATSPRERILRSSLGRMASRMFSGSFGEMANFLVSSGDLSDEELTELRDLIDRLSKGEKDE